MTVRLIQRDGDADLTAVGREILDSLSRPVALP